MNTEPNTWLNWINHQHLVSSRYDHRTYSNTSWSPETERCMSRSCREWPDSTEHLTNSRSLSHEHWTEHMTQLNQSSASRVLQIRSLNLLKHQQISRDREIHEQILQRMTRQHWTSDKLQITESWTLNRTHDSTESIISISCPPDTITELTQTPADLQRQRDAWTDPAENDQTALNIWQTPDHWVMNTEPNTWLNWINHQHLVFSRYDHWTYSNTSRSPETERCMSRSCREWPDTTEHLTNSRSLSHEHWTEHMTQLKQSSASHVLQIRSPNLLKHQLISRDREMHEQILQRMTRQHWTSDKLQITESWTLNRTHDSTESIISISCSPDTITELTQTPADLQRQRDAWADPAENDQTPLNIWQTPDHWVMNTEPNTWLNWINHQHLMSSRYDHRTYSNTSRSPETERCMSRSCREWPDTTEHLTNSRSLSHEHWTEHTTQLNQSSASRVLQIRSPNLLKHQQISRDREMHEQILQRMTRQHWTSDKLQITESWTLNRTHDSTESIISISCPPDTITELTQTPADLQRQRDAWADPAENDQTALNIWQTPDEHWTEHMTQLNHSQWINSSHFTCFSSSTIMTNTIRYNKNFLNMYYNIHW